MTDADLTKSEKKIPLMECFGPTIQGEGLLAGKQTYFLRFGLCDFKCAMCDSMHSVDPLQVRDNAHWLTEYEIVSAFIKLAYESNSACHTVTLSGGNPCMHKIGGVVSSLKSMMYTINVETQGTLMPDWLDDVDYITCSPKGPGMGEVFNEELFTKFVRKYYDKLIVKIVLFDQRDIEFAVDVFKIARKYGVKHLYLSLGNPFPPQHPNTAKVSEKEMKLKLLDTYAMLAEEILQDRRLCDCTFLPQLHVLAWGNKAEV